MDRHRALRAGGDARWPGSAIDRFGRARDDRTASHCPACLRLRVQCGIGGPCTRRLPAGAARRSGRPQTGSSRRHLLLRIFYTHDSLCRRPSATACCPLSSRCWTGRRDAEFYQSCVGICSKGAPGHGGKPVVGGLSARRRDRWAARLEDHSGVWLAFHFHRGRNAADPVVGDPCHCAPGVGELPGRGRQVDASGSAAPCAAFSRTCRSRAMSHSNLQEKSRQRQRCSSCSGPGARPARCCCG